MTVREFNPATADILQQLKRLSASLTRLIRSSDGKRFEQYVRTLALPGWIDYGRVKLVDKREGLKRVNASFVGLQPLYRLLVAAAGNRAFPAAELTKLIGQEGQTVLDGDSPPPEPEHDPAQLVEPESL